MLSFFRVLATGMPLNSFDEVAGCSESTMQLFFIPFAEWLVGQYEVEILSWPTTPEMIEKIERPFKGLGLPGCIGSMDGVHVASDAVPVSLTGDHCGKESYPTVVFNVTSGHNRRVINVAGPFPGAFSDKNTVERDTFVEEVRTSGLYNSFDWQCFQANGMVRTIKGLWILCDQGYLSWRATICAFCSAVAGPMAVRWNRLVSATRKDIECTFGIMKKRFRILRLPLLFRPITKIGTIFRCCAILHNMLLDYDGLADIGQEESHWIAQDDMETTLAAMSTGRAGTELDLSYLGEAFNPVGLPSVEDSKHHHGLKEALLEHFTYMKQTRQIRWLKTAAQIREEASNSEESTQGDVYL